jgi:hypothetical protein
MADQDISPFISLAKTEPDEAVKNINAAKEFGLDLGMDADGYANIKDQLPKEDNTPKTASRHVAQVISKSSQHASAMKEDIEKMNWFSRQASYIKDTLQQKDKSMELFDLVSRDLWGSAFGREYGDNEALRVDELNNEIKERSGGLKEYDYTYWESLPAGVAGGVYDMIGSVTRNLETVGIGVGVGAGAGAITMAPSVPVLGPVPMIAGAVIGGAKGGVAGAGAAMIQQSVAHGSAQVYNDLNYVYNDDPTFKALPDDQKRQIAKGAGVLMGMVSIMPVKAISKRVPWINKIVNPRSFVKTMQSATGSKWMNLAKDLAVAGAAEGTEEGLQSIIQTVAKTYGETWDGNETDFVDGLRAALITNASETYTQAAQEGFIGALTGSVVTGGLRTVNPLLGAYTPDNMTPIPKSKDGSQSLEVAQQISTHAAVLKETRTNKELSAEMDEIVQKTYEDNGLTSVWIDKEEVNKWAGDEDKAKKAMDLIGDNSFSIDLDAPIQVPSSKIARLVQEFPDAAGLIKVDPETPSAFNFIESKTKVREQPEPELVKDEEKVIVAPESEVDKALKIDSDKEIERVVEDTQVFKELQQVDVQRIQKESPERFQLVEEFFENKLVFDEDAIPKDGTPAHAIDYNSLSEEQKLQYQPKQRMFKDGGMSLDDVANIYGVDSAVLLDTLVNTPTRQQIIERNIKEQEIDNQDFEKGGLSIETMQTVQVYDSETTRHLSEATDMGHNRYLPEVGSLKVESKARIGKTKLKHLNVTQWKVAEQRAIKKSIISEGESGIESFVREKINAATSSQMAAQTHVAIGKVNRALRFIGKVHTDRVQAELKVAGKTYSEAVNYLLGPYRFDKKGDLNSYAKYAKMMNARGETDFDLPASIVEWLDGSESASELSVDDMLFLESRLRRAVHSAYTKNQLYTKFKDKADAFTFEMIEDQIAEEAESHSKFDESRNEELVGADGYWEQVKDFMETLGSKLKNNAYIAENWSDGKQGSFLSKVLHQQIQGVGEYAGEFGMVAKNNLLDSINIKVAKVRTKYYSNKDWFNLRVTKVKVPEFKGSKLKPNQTKGSLIAILANMGNDYNKKAIERFGLSQQRMFQILSKYLTKNDFDFVQEGMWDTFQDMKGRVAEVHKIVTGNDLEFVEPVGFTMFGTKYKGGYYPARYKGTTDDFLDAVIAEIKGEEDIRPATDGATFHGMVKAPHLEERVGSEQLVDIDLDVFSESLEEVAHHITMQIPILNVSKILKSPKVKRALIGATGKRDYELFRDNVAEMTKSVKAHESRIHRQQQAFMSKVYNNVMGAAAISWIAYNMSSMVASLYAFPQVMRRMGGPQGIPYLIRASMKLPFMWNKAHALLSDNDPSISKTREGIDDSRREGIRRQLPPDRAIKSKAWNTLKRMQESVTSFAFDSILDGFDKRIKVISGTAAYSQYMNGDAPGHDYNSVYKGKTQQEIHENAVAYMFSVVEGGTMRAGTLDKAQIQKEPLGRLFTHFWNEMRGNLQNDLQQRRNLIRDSKAVKDHVKNGEFFKANLALQGASQNMMGFWLNLMVSMMITNFILGKNLTDEEDREKDEFSFDESLSEFPDWVLSRFSSWKGFLEMAATRLSPIPGVSQVVFGTMTGRDASVPIAQVLTDVARAGNGAATVYNNMAEGLTFLESTEAMTNKEVRGLLMTTAYSVGGLPMNAITKFSKYANDEENEGMVGDVAMGAGATVALGGVKLLDLFKQFLGMQDDDDKALMEAMSDDDAALLEVMEEDKAIGEMPNKKEVVEAIKASMPEVTVSADDVPVEWFDAIKFTESSGKWNARPGTSGAFGFYQFLPGTWREIVNSPEGKEAKLTIGGRMQRNQKQQETAIRIFTEWNMKELVKTKTPITLESLYFKHHFGRAANAELVYNAGVKDTAKIPSGLFSKAAIRANPKLKPLKTIGDVKGYILDALERGLRHPKYVEKYAD